MKPPGASKRPDKASGRRDTKQEDHFKGKRRLRKVSIVSVSRVFEQQRKTILLSLSISAKTASKRSTDKHLKGAAKSKSIGGKNLARKRRYYKMESGCAAFVLYFKTKRMLILLTLEAALQIQ
jgi:hypothetical protein